MDSSLTQLEYVFLLAPLDNFLSTNSATLFPLTALASPTSSIVMPVPLTTDLFKVNADSVMALILPSLALLAPSTSSSTLTDNVSALPPTAPASTKSQEDVSVVLTD